MTPTSQQPQTSPSGEVPCSYHPGVMTRLRCSRCAKPICPKEAVRTPVGLRCPDCAGVRGLPTYRTPAGSIAKAAGLGLAVAVAVGIVWGFFPAWQFYLALALGFGAVEVMARAAKYKRGRDLQFLAMAVVLTGLVVSRVILSQRFDIPFGEINQLGDFATFYLQLRVIPDLIYAAIPLLIAWFRFR
jgi:DNA-directed RNA polymerase subunit RPC12/RpoP